MLTAIAAMLMTPLPEGAQDMPFQLSISVSEAGAIDAGSITSISIRPMQVSRIALDCDDGRSFCARTLDAYVSDAGIARSVHLHLREWDGEDWVTVATPTIMFQDNMSGSQGVIETAGTRLTVTLASPALPEPRTI